MIRPCLLIPVYNHGHTIEATWASLKQYGLGCILVDDGSHPATASVLDRLAAKGPGIQLVRRDHNGGKGAAVLTGLTAAQRLGYTHALQIDADGQHDAGDVPAMLALSEKEPTALISGAPQYGHDIPRARRYGRYITHAWVWLETLSFDIIDSMCGFRVYPIAATTTLAEQVEIGQHMDFDIEIMVRLYWAGTPVRFMNTRVTYPEDGISHFHPWRDNLRISWMHTKLVSQMLWQSASRLFQRKAPAAHWSQYRERGSLVGIQLCLWCYRLLGRRALEYLLYRSSSGFSCLHEQHATPHTITCNGCWVDLPPPVNPFHISSLSGRHKLKNCLPGAAIYRATFWISRSGNTFWNKHAAARAP
jgi:glycosyltransferase involved in cell wall biosynthesis